LGIAELREVEFEAGILWTARSIGVVKAVIYLLWIAMIGSLALLLGFGVARINGKSIIG
jgi:hypothetical protein